jgi:predicted dehydrogenase
MLYFFGTPVKASGIAENQAGLYIPDDLVTGHIRFESGVIFSGIWCFTVPPGEERDTCEIIGSKGTISFSIFKHEKLVVSTGADMQVFSFDALEHVQQPMIGMVVKYFLGNAPNPCPAEAGIQTMQLIDIFTKK